MRSFRISRRFVIALLGIGVVLVMNIGANQIRNSFHRILSPVERALWNSGARASDSIQSVLHIGSLKASQRLLTEEANGLLQELQNVKDVEKENEQLRSAVSLKQKDGFKFAGGTVLAKLPEEDMVWIEGGTSDGIAKGMPAITADRVVVGRVEEAGEYVSLIRLITVNGGSFDARAGSSSAIGVVRGEGSGVLLLDLIPRNAVLSEGDPVFTTSLGGVFPDALLVGKVGPVEGTSTDPFRRSSIIPAVGIQDLNLVLVITNHINP